MHVYQLSESFCLKKSAKHNQFSNEFFSDQSLLITKSPCIPYIPELGDKIGTYPALLLQQIHYWMQKQIAKDKQNKHWIPNSYDSWAQQLRCSLSCIRNAVKKLEQEDLIKTKAFRSHYGDTTKSYTVNYEALTKLGLSVDEDLFSYKAQEQDNSFNSYRSIPVALNENQSSCRSSNFQKPGQGSKSNASDTHVSLYDTPLIKIKKIINNLSPACAESVYKNIISIWNEIVHQGSKAVQLTERRLRYLKRRFKVEFEGDLEKWKSYCRLIAKNDFLMGMGKKGWKATLDWAINSHNIQKVFGNQYQHWIEREGKINYELNKTTLQPKEIPFKTPEQLHKETENLKQEIESFPQSAFSKKLSTKLLHHYGSSKFKSWFKELTYEEPCEDKVRVGTPTPFIKDWLNNNFYEGILVCCQKINPAIVELEFTVGHKLNKSQQRGEGRGTAQIKIEKKTLSSRLEKENEQEETRERSMIEIQERIIEQSTQPLFWQEASKNLLYKIGINKYKAWLSGVSFKGQYHNTVTLIASSEQKIRWLKRNYFEHILECCQKLDPKISYVEFVCN